MIYRFQDFELDEAGLELRQNGVAIAIQARVLRALIHLVKNRERVVSKDELCDAVWQDMVVSDAALAQVIMLVRKALGDEGEQQALLKTVRGRGFRFVANLTELAASDCVSPPLPAAGPQHTLVGRSSELQALQRFVEQARNARGACVLIAGDPGIGKSSLVEALATDAAARGVEVSWGKAWEDGGAPPFWPFIQVLRSLVARHGLQRLERASGSGWHELAALMSEATEDTSARVAKSQPAQDTAATRFRLFDAMARLLRALSTDHKPTQLIILEDLHACDDASLSLLRYLNRELSGASLLIVATFRELALAQLPTLRNLVDSVSGSQRLQLRALAAADSEVLLQRNLAEPPSQRLAAAVYELSGGNPLCIAELARHISAGNLPVFSLQNAVPERICQVVRLQLEALPNASVEALQHAAVLGRSFAQPFLAQLLEISELELLERLHPALACGLLRTAAAAELSFAHALVRNAVYAELSSHRRAQLHQQVAETLEARAEPALLPLHELAHHYHLAAGSGGRHKAIEYAVLAAEHAAQMRAFETAAELQERAYALSALENIPAHELIQRAFNTGYACYAAGQLESAVRYYERAAEIARQIQDHEARAYAVGLAGFVMRGTIMFNRTRQRQLREAMLALPEGDLPIKAILLPVSNMGETGSSALLQRRAAVDAGIAMARRIGQPWVVARTLSSSHHALWGAAPPHELAAISHELIEVAGRCNDPEMLLDALIWRICDSVELGEGLAVEQLITEYLSQLEHHHSGWHRYMGAILKYVQVSCEGDFARADHLSQRAAELGLQQHEPSALSFLAVRSLFRYLDGRADDFDLEPPADLPASYSVFWMVAWARSCSRELQARARAALAAAKTRGFDNLPLDPLRRPTLAMFGMCAIELGEREHAQELYALLSEHDGAHVLLQPGVYLGPISLHLGLLAASVERPSVAAGHFEAAIEACLQMCSRGTLWTVQTSYARMLIENRALVLEGETCCPQLRAQQLLEGAQLLSEELGCEPWQRQTRELQALRSRLAVA